MKPATPLSPSASRLLALFYILELAFDRAGDRDVALDLNLDRVRARDGAFDHGLHDYLYGSELLVRCMDVDGYVSKPVREQLMDSILIEPWEPAEDLKSLLS